MHNIYNNTCTKKSGKYDPENFVVDSLKILAVLKVDKDFFHEYCITSIIRLYSLINEGASLIYKNIVSPMYKTMLL